MPALACPPPRATGLSLLELLIGLAVAALLLAAGIPALNHLVLESRMTAAVNDLVSDLHLARQAANVRTTAVTVCPVAADGRCRREGTWHHGWQITTQSDKPDTATGAGEILRRRSGLPKLTVTSNRQAFSFRPFTLRDTNGTIGFCDERGIDAARALVISPSGRPRLASRAETRQRISC